MLKLIDLRKSFGAVKAVDGLSLEVPRGSVFGFLGPNGAGKTTTISMAVGLLRPDSGSVVLDGSRNPLDPAARSMIGVSPQAIALYDELTADENLRFFAQLYEMSRSESLRRADEVLGLVGLTDRRSERVKGFSGGMKRRLNLAAAIMHGPRLLLLDEPTAGVDPQSRSAILEIVKTLREQGVTIVYTTHYMEEAEKICDQVAVIDHGKLLAVDAVEGLIAKHGGGSVVTFSTEAGEQRVATNDPVGELSRRLTSPDVRNVRIDRPDLEAVFLNLTGRSLRD
ncbi:MAG: ABC transporter ATP-binding protein [Phycisphaerales bacterium]|nr:ABC transporter ATP-binding protein [Phycisphaerales bacterium]